MGNTNEPDDGVDEAAVGTLPTDRRPRSVAWLVLGVGIAVAVGLLVLSRLTASGPSVTAERASDREAVTHEFVIPDGTAQRVAAGEVVEIVPERLVVDVGDTVRVRNEDVEASNVGIFYVRPGETVTMRFSSPGRLEGVCDVHPSGQFVIDVRG